MIKTPLKVTVNTWPSAFFNPGGGELQLNYSTQHLAKKGIKVTHFSQWAPTEELDIFHQFSMEFGVREVIANYKRLNKKIAVSPIFWTIPNDPFHYNYAKDIMNMADVLLTNSELESERLSSEFNIDRHKFFKTRNAITENYFSIGNASSFRKKYDISKDFVLSVANIDTRKNTELLVKACKKLDLPLITIGKVRDPHYFNTFKNLYSGYQHIDPIYDTDLLKSAYSACKVFALPSICETPGIAALEAASQNSSLLITKEGSTKEYFKHQSVRFVDPFDLENLITELQEIWQAPRPIDLRQDIIENYTWDKCADDIIAAYSSLN